MCSENKAAPIIIVYIVLYDSEEVLRIEAFTCFELGMSIRHDFITRCQLNIIISFPNPEFACIR
jgi:hypothetical protein